MLEQEFIEKMQGKLLNAKSDLQTELDGLKPHTEFGDDEGDGASEFEVDAVSQDVMGRIKKDLEKIDWALGKIANGTYGTDDEGNEISKERLEAIPWADTAI